MSIFDYFKREKKIFDYFRSESKDNPGLILPSDYALSEIPTLDEVTASVAPVNWKLLDINNLPNYPMYNQDGSSSCVAMSWALIASILYKQRTGNAIKFSPAWLYQQRINKPGLGMIGTDIAKIASEGILPHDLMPCMDMGEVAINTIPTYPWYKDVAKVFATEDKLIQLPIGDIDTVASTMQVTGKPVNVWYSFAGNEWTSVPVVITTTPGLRHSVVAIDYGIYKGQKCLVIQDSWGPNSTQYQGRRIITEDFHKKRNLFAGYPRRFRFDVSNTKGIYNGSIVSFQESMRSIGLFPQGVNLVENWGPLTKKACMAYQKLNNIPQTGIIDTATKQLLILNFK